MRSMFIRFLHLLKSLLLWIVLRLCNSKEHEVEKDEKDEDLTHEE